ncbi:hypothetical protein RAH57_03585 [Chryseobacterium sp. CKR4-1]|uniref:hypothetical protein n=1 Tax=Chryseobacterium sp. CKR4-1 TaxID=3068896 RepID=UPI00279697CD|nr:hypothetical protein [Chryseobacterium sp. CKR4-1]MDQ1803053.1 hypothetical protein [Chryseobacterium sp. CKR4-1]
MQVIFQVREKETTIGITLPPEALDIYKWHNGTHFLEDKLARGQNLFFGAVFSALEIAVENHIYYSKSDRDFKKQYFTLFETIQGVLFLVDCDKTSASYGRILKHDISRAISLKAVTPIYDYVNCWLETIIQCYRSGIYSIGTQDSEPVLDSDYLAEIELSKKMNPNDK